MRRTLIIAEAGVNHNGSLETALRLVEEASHAGADIIKFQTFRADALVTKKAKMAHYQAKNLGKQESQYVMLKRLELSADNFMKIHTSCKQKGIGFLSTAFDLESITELTAMDMSMWKVPSGEITNQPYLEAISKTGQPILLSTGMSTMEEISEALGVIQQNGNQQVTLLHCTTEYPAPYDEINLMAMQAMKERFQLPVGYSDHSAGIEVAIAAVALGATVIEKHFTIDRNLEGPDHKASLDPSTFSSMVSSIRNIEAAMGDGIKQPTRSELANRLVARKSIVARKNIRRGDTFTWDNLTTKRPGNGLSPMKWYDVLGKRAGRDYHEDEMIEENV